jgi:hypothetical protein
MMLCQGHQAPLHPVFGLVLSWLLQPLHFLARPEP